MQFLRFKLASLVGGIVFGAFMAGSSESAVNVLTNHYDNNRTSANLSETTLSPATVNAASFAKLWSYAVDGAIFAQHLYVQGVTVSGQSSAKNVLYVATMHDVLYAFDADNPTGPLWTHDYRATGVTPGTPYGASNWTGDAVGIIGTPVIDAPNFKLYLVTATIENSAYVQRLHVVDIRSGIDLGAVVISGTSNGQTFDPKLHSERPGLALADGQVWLAFGSTLPGDFNPWHGWVMTYDATSLAQTGIFVTTGTGAGAGIWQSGAAPAVDSSGNVYYLTGNASSGSYDGVNNFQESLLQFNYNGGLTLNSWYTSQNWQFLDQNDQDLSASGPTLIPGSGLVVFGQKYDLLTLLNTSKLGGLTAKDAQAVQEFQFDATPTEDRIINLAYWQRPTNSLMFAWPEVSALTAYTYNGSTFTQAQKNLQVLKGEPGAGTSLSANGTTVGSGIVWAVHHTGTGANMGAGGDVGTPAVVEAYNADNITTMLWSSTMNPLRDNLGSAGRFVMPVVANGKLYSATTGNTVQVYGLWASTHVTAPPALAVPCAVDYQTCSIPVNIQTATIYYGAGSNWAIIPGQSGSVTCTPAALAVPDPASGVQKTCEYLPITAITPVAVSASTPPLQAVACAVDYGTCALPNYITATIYYGVGSTWTAVPDRSGTVKCLNTNLGIADPAPGMTKSCLYVANPVLAAPPPAAVACAVDHGTCTLPAGAVATVYYGAGNNWYPIPAQSGSFTCLNTTFGVADPASGVQKSCKYVADSTATSLPPGAKSCAVDNAVCGLPAGQLATVYYGAGSTYATITGVSGNFTCLNTTFGIADPASGVQKSCNTVPPAPITPPAKPTVCAVDGGTCAIPSGTTVTLYYGTGSTWDFIPGQSGNVACNYIAFNVPDPAQGTQKTCEY